jgi:hypothetical protein
LRGECILAARNEPGGKKSASAQFQIGQTINLFPLLQTFLRKSEFVKTREP